MNATKIAYIDLDGTLADRRHRSSYYLPDGRSTGQRYTPRRTSPRIRSSIPDTPTTSTSPLTVPRSTNSPPAREGTGQRLPNGLSTTASRGSGSS